MRAENEWEFVAFNLHIPLRRHHRRIVTPGDYLFDTVEVRCKLSESRRHFDDHARRYIAQLGNISEELHSVAEPVQASQYHAFVAQRFTLPKTMRIEGAPAANRIALTPCQFEMAEKHIHHPTPCSARIGIGAANLCALK